MVSVNSKEMAIKIGTGADVTVIPEESAPSGIPLTPISRLYGPGHLKVVTFVTLPFLDLNSKSDPN